jgi:hypothetical protein
MTFDLIDALQLGASAAIVVAAYTFVFGKSLRERVVIASVFTLWFAFVVAMGATRFFGVNQALGTPALGVAVALPLFVFSAVAFSRKGRTRLDEVALEPLVAVQAVRILGVMFLLLLAANRLPSPFALLAGAGDMIVGIEALPLAWWLSRNPRGAHGAFLFWTYFGILDLAVAIFLGATSSPGPARLFFGATDASLMTTLPLIVVPCFLVPSLLFMHFITLYKVRNASPARISTAAQT